MAKALKAWTVVDRNGGVHSRSVSKAGAARIAARLNRDPSWAPWAPFVVALDETISLPTPTR